MIKSFSQILLLLCGLVFLTGCSTWHEIEHQMAVESAMRPYKQQLWAGQITHREYRQHRELAEMRYQDYRTEIRVPTAIKELPERLEQIEVDFGASPEEAPSRPMAQGLLSAAPRPGVQAAPAASPSQPEPTLEPKAPATTVAEGNATPENLQLSAAPSEEMPAPLEETDEPTPSRFKVEVKYNEIDLPTFNITTGW